MPDNLDEWIRLVSYISGAVGGGMMLYGMWSFANAYWDAQFDKDENDKNE